MRMREPQSSGAHHLNLCHIVEKSAKAHPISHWGARRNSCDSRAASAVRLHVDEMLQPGPLIANTKTRFVWLIWSCITHEWKFVLLAVTVTTQLLRWRVWENGVFQSIMLHLLHIYSRQKKNKTTKQNKKKTGSESKRADEKPKKSKTHCWVWRRKWSVSLTSLNRAHINTEISIYCRAISGIWVTAKLQKSSQSTVVSQYFSKPNSQVWQHETPPSQRCGLKK